MDINLTKRENILTFLWLLNLLKTMTVMVITRNTMLSILPLGDLPISILLLPSVYVEPLSMQRDNPSVLVVWLDYLTHFAV